MDEEERQPVTSEKAETVQVPARLTLDGNERRGENVAAAMKFLHRMEEPITSQRIFYVTDETRSKADSCTTKKKKNKRYGEMSLKNIL